MTKIFRIFSNLLKSRIFYLCLAVFVILGAIAVYIVRTDFLKYTVSNRLNVFLPQFFPEYVIYQNNALCSDMRDIDFENNDVREICILRDRSRLTNHSRGFSLEFPADAQYDFTAAEEYIDIKCKNFTAVVSKEFSTYGDGVENSRRYVAECINKYILDEKYLKENNITLHQNNSENINGYDVQVIALTRTPASGSDVEYNTYVYCYVFTESNMFYRIMFRSSEYDGELMDEVHKTLSSLRTDVAVRGVFDTFTEFKPEIPKDWNLETRELYYDIVFAENCKWGIYTPRAIEEDKLGDVKALENKINTKFDGVLEYTYLFSEIPLEGMQSAYEDGKFVELTLQTSTVMNLNLNGKNPVFDVIDGQYDEKIREMAGILRDFGHPVLFRLNNEMNSDWTSYSGAACLTDPEIYVQVWQRIYRIFEEEGVDNAIWIFNPNDKSFPPNGYNTSIAYYPGDEYVHMFGITGYNTGTYYDELNGERWRTFDEIYSAITEKYKPVYGEFPWVITEFASSSVGGDKAQWIRDMFRDLKKYPNIKLAFWFNSADYDSRPEFLDNLARPYWFDETPETTKAFAEGLRENMKQGKE